MYGEAQAGGQWLATSQGIDKVVSSVLRYAMQTTLNYEPSCQCLAGCQALPAARTSPYAASCFESIGFWLSSRPCPLLAPHQRSNLLR